MAAQEEEGQEKEIEICVFEKAAGNTPLYLYGGPEGQFVST
jgi:hypothetical protein